MRVLGLFIPSRLKSLEKFPAFQDAFVLTQISSSLGKSLDFILPVVQSGLESFQGSASFWRMDSETDPRPANCFGCC